jgi:hypothetical protein
MKVALLLGSDIGGFLGEWRYEEISWYVIAR